MTDIKDAVSGINSKANEAAQALGEHVHALRRTEIKYSNATITINLFKTILRDIQWFYEPKQMDQILIIMVHGSLAFSQLINLPKNNKTTYLKKAK